MLSCRFIITKHDYCYTVGLNHITNADVVKDLGIFVDESLTFSNHICLHRVATGATTRANLIHKCFLSTHILTLVILAFVVYVQPLLDYASPLWNPHVV